MSTTPISSSTSNTASSGSSSTHTDAFSQLKPDDFLKIMITELQHQDPTQPMDSAQIVQQLGSIQNIATNQSLQTTLTGLAVGQSLASASSLISQGVEGLDNNGKTVSGIVAGVSITNGTPTLILQDGSGVSLNNVQQIIPGADLQPATSTSNK